jgi:uncharacterized protein (TIGR03000 family)
MFKRLLVSLGSAALALTMTANPAVAQHGHANVGVGHAHAMPHVSSARPAATFNHAHVGVGSAHVAPHTAFARPATAFYGGNAARYAAANHYYNGRNYAARYPYYGYGRYGYGRYGYGYPYYGYPYYGYGSGLLLGLGLGYGYSNYGYGYPYSATYPDYNATYPDPGAYNVIAPQTTVSGYPAAEPAPAPVPATAARLTIQLPADARLWIDGQPTVQTGAVRTFETPANLDPGRRYTYQLHAEWSVNGQVVSRDRDVSFQAGNQSIVNMIVP